MRTRLRRLAACVALVATLAAVAQAQQSAFQDAEGESSVFLRDGGGFARVNATDKSVELGFTRDTGREKPFFGIDFKGKASGGFASLFSGGTPSPEAEVGFTIGKRFITMKSDKEVVEECKARVIADLKATGLPKLIEKERERFIKNKTAENLKRLKKAEDELNQSGGDSLAARIKRELYNGARSKGLSEEASHGIAESLAPKLVEAELARQAREQALVEAASPAGQAEIRNTVEAGVDDEAAGLCVLDPETLDARAFDWLNFRVSYKRARYKILNESAAFADQVRKQNFDGYTATLAYNRVITLDDLSAEALETATRSKGLIIVGVSIGVERRNNSDDLDSVELEDQNFTSSSETTQRRAVSKQTVLSGDYQEFTAVPLNTDVVWFPGALRSRVAIDFFTRSNLGSTDRKFVPGVGLFLTKEKSPTKVVGGISFSVDDGKGKVGLVGGFNF